MSQESPPIKPSGFPVTSIHHLPVTPGVTAVHRSSGRIEHKHVANSKIRAASVHMIFAARLSQEFISPEHAHEVENWTGEAVLQALSKFDIETEVRIRCCSTCGS